MSLENMEKRLNEFLDNHWPTMQRRMGRIEGVTWVMLPMLGLIMTMMGVLIVLVVRG